MKSLKLLVVTLSIAMLMAISACTSPASSFSESEVIELVRNSAIARDDLCWEEGKNSDYSGDLIHDPTLIAAVSLANPTSKEPLADRDIDYVSLTASASLKENGLWVVKAHSDWAINNGHDIRSSCIFLFDDTTAEVRLP